MSHVNLLKELSGKSSDALQLAVKNALSERDQEQFELYLVKLNEFMKTSESGKSDGKKTKQHIASNLNQKQQFIKLVLPQIQSMMAERDINERSTILPDSKYNWELNLGFVDEFCIDKIKTIEDLKLVHVEIVKQEKTISNIQLVLAYYRGFVYSRARDLVPPDVNIKEFMYITFNVSYTTVRRYTSFHELIDCYPGLMICQLTFLQIIQHKNELLSYLDTDETLASKLRQYVSITAQNKPVDIEATKDVCEQTNYKYDCSPNWVFEQSQVISHSDVEPMNVEDENELLKQMDELCQTYKESTNL